MTYSGQVRDAFTEQGLPGATVIYNIGGAVAGAGICDSNGQFSIDTNYDADSVTISSAGYKLNTFPVYGNIQPTFDLERNVKELPPVIVKAKQKPMAPATTTTDNFKKYLPWAMAGVLAILFFMKDEKK